MLSADLLGFHIYDYARHFMDACAKVMGHNDVSIENNYIQAHCEPPPHCGALLTPTS